VKRVPLDTPCIRVNVQTIRIFQNNAFSDGTHLYGEILWSDQYEAAILMNDWHTTLRTRIEAYSNYVHLDEREWFRIIFGIVDRLSEAHAGGIVHGDLTPSNGSSHSRATG
jgi:serine/threonine protein kinase